MFTDIIYKLLAQLSSPEVDALHLMVQDERKKRSLDTLTPDEQELLKSPGGKVNATLAYRKRVGCGLSQAKETVEMFIEKNS